MSSLYYEPKTSFLASRHVRNFENAARDGRAHCAYYLSVRDIGKTSAVHTGLVLFSNQVSMSNHRADRVGLSVGRGQLKCDGTRAETRFRLSTKRRNPFKSAGASVQSTTGSPDVRISGSNAGYTMFRGSVKGTGYPLHSPVTPSLPLPCVTVCHYISTGV